MMKSVRGVSIALIALLTAASACFAADPPATGAPSTTGSLWGQPGQASLGGGMGLSRFMADADYTSSRDGGGKGRDLWGTRDAAMRFAFAANLRYTASKHTRWQVSPGFLWAGYKDNARSPFRTDYFPTDSLKGKWLTLVMPASFQFQFLQRGQKWLFHEGVGPGVYRVWVEQDRHVVKDPATKRLHRGFYPGATAEFGMERFTRVLPAVSIEVSAASHYVFAERDEQFPSGFNSNLWTVEARIGANYHFNPRVQKKATPKK